MPYNLLNKHTLRRPAQLAGVICTIALLTATWLFGSPSAYAHSRLIRSEPVSGADMAQSPQLLKLYFTEDIGLDFSSVKLLDRARKEYPLGPPAHDGNDNTSMVVAVQESLPPGSYIAIWRAVSAVDGHLTVGGLPFRVGPAGQNEPPLTADQIAPPGTQGSPEASFAGLAGDGDQATPLRWFVRGLILANAALLLGGAIFTVLVVEPSAAESGSTGAALYPMAGSRFAQIASWSAITLLCALGIDLIMQLAVITQTDFFGVFSHGRDAQLLLVTTRYGFAWVMKTVAAALLVALMVFVWVGSRRGGSGLWEVSIGAGSLLLLAEALSSHGAAAVNAGQLLGLPIPIISDWLHLVTAATWVGGLAYLAFALYPAFRQLGLSPEARRAFLGKSIPRFSKLAIASVALLAITGSYNLLIHSTDLGTIAGSVYGQVVAIKIILFLALIGIGAINLRRLSPALQAKSRAAQAKKGGIGEAAKLNRNVRIEIVLAALALLCAGGLTLLPPPSPGGSSYAAAGAAAGAAPASGITPVAVTTQTPPTDHSAKATSTINGYIIALAERTTGAGDELTLTVSQSSGTNVAAAPLTDVAKIFFKVTPQDVEAGSASFQAAPAGQANANMLTWRASGVMFPLEGVYICTAVVQRTQANDLKAAFLVTIKEDGGLSITATPLVDLRLTTMPSPPSKGIAELHIILKDEQGALIEGARLTFSANKTTSGRAPVTGAAQPVAGQPGIYTAQINFDAPGAWLLLFTIERDGQRVFKSDASLDVVDSVPTQNKP